MSEADAMWNSEMAAYGAEYGMPDPEFEVIHGKRQDRVFEGSRAACWAFKRVNGGFVRPWTGEDDIEDYRND